MFAMRVSQMLIQDLEPHPTAAVAARRDFPIFQDFLMVLSSHPPD